MWRCDSSKVILRIVNLSNNIVTEVCIEAPTTSCKVNHIIVHWYEADADKQVQIYLESYHQISQRDSRHCSLVAIVAHDTTFSPKLCR